MNAMGSSWRIIQCLVWRSVSCLSVAFALLPFAMHGQAARNEPSELDVAMANVSHGDVGARDVVVIANVGAVQAIPALEEQFRRSADPDIKLSIASGLVKLKDRDGLYWNFLLEQVTPVIDSDIPDPVFSESPGKATVPNSQLQAWANAHGVALDTAGVYAAYDFPAKVLQLAASGDSRGIPLLRRGLRSRNLLIVSFAAKGLAQVQD